MSKDRCKRSLSVWLVIWAMTCVASRTRRPAQALRFWLHWELTTGTGGICRTGQLEWPWCRACYAGPCVPPRVPAPEALQCLDPAPLRPPTGNCAAAAGGPGAIWPWRGRSIEDEALLCSIVTTIRKQGWDPLQALSQLVSQFLTHLIDTSLPPEDVLCSAGHGTFVEPIGMIVWLQVCTVCARSQLA